MSPIKNLSEAVRLPRLGKIHLGIRHPEKGYPMKTDYFVLPKDHPDYQKLVDLFGEKPKALRILIPVEDEEQWASQYYKAYNQTYGLVCKGDGETALRMIDFKTKYMVTKGAVDGVELKEIPCAGQECPEYQAKKCGEVMNLRFLIPEIPGLGVWQIDTGSKNSILNINSCARIIKRAFGRISLIPLQLTFEPIQVNNPEDGKKQTVYVLNLRTDVTLAQLANQAKEQAKMFTLEASDMGALADAQLDQDIENGWGDLTDTGHKKEPAQPPVSTPAKQQPVALPTEDEPIFPEEQETAPEHDEDFAQWVTENLPLAKWTTKTAESWMRSKANYQGLQYAPKFEDTMKRLSPEQAAFLKAEILKRIELA